ncbi:MAG: hypothetical protein WC603_03340 [Candidatus Paceibacterota bacterium]|jgi:hypothetical protein
MEKGPERAINIDRQYLQIDRENLESQLEKISDVLFQISKNDRFDNFSHMAKLADISSKENIRPEDSVQLLDNWDYDSLSYIKNERSGNCVDFAILCQKMLEDVGVPSTIIGRFPEVKDYTKKQADFLKFKHLSIMYTNENNGLNLFILEPSWKFSKPIPIKTGVHSVYKDWESEISQINGTQFIQKAYNAQKDKRRERLYDIKPVDRNFCNQLTKNFIRIPRELKILNTRDEEVIQFLKFNPVKKLFTTNIDGVDKEFSPNFIGAEQKIILEEILEKPDLLEYITKVFDFTESLPDDFWIKD